MPASYYSHQGMTSPEKLPKRVEAAFNFVSLLSGFVERVIYCPQSDSEAVVGRELTPKEESAYAAALDALERYFDQDLYGDINYARGNQGSRNVRGSTHETRHEQIEGGPHRPIKDGTCLGDGETSEKEGPPNCDGT